MLTILRYGADSSAEMEVPDGALLAECRAPRDECVEDLAAAVASALAEPLDYPPLSKCTTPSDRIVVPLEGGVPRGGEIAAALVGNLVKAGVDPDGITVLRTSADAEIGMGDPLPWLPEELAGRITFITHDPDDRKELAYLAAASGGEPILLNRAITEADLVLPIGGYQDREAPGYYGIHTAVFPSFSDQRTIRRFRSSSSLDTQGRPKKKPIEAVKEVGWLLGVTLAVQIVPGPGEAVLHVVAGETGAVQARTDELHRSAWGGSSPRLASLVVAAIEGGSVRQTWHNFGLALAVAMPLVEDGGAIAVCSELDDEPGLGMRRLASQTRAEALKWIRKERPEDSLPAILLARATDQAKVYLLSNLDESIPEDLEITHIGCPEELARLVRRHPSCILVADAPRARVSLESDD